MALSRVIFPLDLSWFSINTYQVLCCPDPRTVSFVPFHILYPGENFSEDRQTSVILKIYFTFPIIYSFWNIYSSVFMEESFRMPETVIWHNCGYLLT